MTTSPRLRADRLLVERGLFDSRAKAQAAIAAGLVSANGMTVRKASEEIASDAAIKATPAHPYVSRGGLKLAAALDHFGFDPKDRVCLDVGASTGGFTQVLLECGAAQVYAVDVGRGQLHDSLRARPEVVSLEATDIRNVAPDHFDQKPDLVTVDVSFISLKQVLPAALRFDKGAGATRCADQAAIRSRPRRAQERHRARRNRAPGRVRRYCRLRDFARLAHYRCIIPSPIAGGDGNIEFLLGATRD